MSPEGNALSPRSHSDPHRQTATGRAGGVWPPRWLAGRVVPLVGGAIVLAMLFAGLGDAGVWDPVELRGADLAQGIAGQAAGTTRDALGAGELPFDSMALGFRVFGPSALAGRLPLALWALVGVLALYMFLARLVDPRAGVYGAVVLATMPLYFVHARTMLGDVVTMACGAVAFAGLAIAVFDRASPAESESRVARRRAAGFALGLVGLALGFLCRGALLGVAIPALSVGLAWALSGVAVAEYSDRRGDVLGVSALVVGVGAAALGVHALITSQPGSAPLVLGFRIAAATRVLPTFDATIAQLGHALFPWSALLPFALGRILRAPPAELDAGVSRESHVRLALLTGASVAFGMHALLAHHAAALPFAAPAVLAAVLAITLRDLERGAPPSPTIALGVACLGFLLVRDHLHFPEKGLVAFVAPGATFPESFQPAARAFVIAAGVAFVAGGALAWLAVDAALVRRFFSTRAPARGAVMVAAGALAVALLRFGYYPGLAAHVSPKGIFDAYARLHRGSEPLALLGVSAHTAAYVGAKPDSVVRDVPQAFAWLTASDERRWLALRGDDLPVLNALFRGRGTPPRNLPVLDGRSSQMVLASNRLRDDEESESPLDAVVLSRDPAPAHVVDARMGGSLEPLGWDIVDGRGSKSDSVRAGRPYHVRVYYKVRAPITGGYCTFLHVDHAPTRFAAEHKDWARYPMHLWRAGDVVVDDFEVSLPAHFRAGSYPLYFGLGDLPCTDDRRMPVTQGRHDGHGRVVGGALAVRS